MTQPPAGDRDQGAGAPARDPRLAGFASGGVWDACPPSAALAAVAEAVSGPGRRCPGATDDELAGLVRRWAAVESWASAGKLGVVGEMARREVLAGAGSGWQGEVQGTGMESLNHELSLALAVSAGSAEKTVWLARELEERLPGVRALLTDGTLSQSKARMLAEELSVLGDVDAAHAEALIIGRLAGKTHGQLGRLAAQAACTVDPDGAEKRRKQAQDDARVRLWREQSGAAAIAGYGLPSDEALAAFANVGARAREYKDSRAFPDARMDQLRAMAYLDLLNGVPAADRIARAIARAGAETRDDEDGGAGGAGGIPDDDPRDDGPAGDAPCIDDPGSDPGGGGPGSDGSRGGGSGSGDLGDGDPGPHRPCGDDEPGGGQPGCRPPSSGPEPGPGRLPALQDLIVPLLTLLGLARRPGEGHGLGPLDPGLALDLAAAAALSPLSQWCVTITDADGIAIGHGCARPVKAGRPGPAGSSAGALVAFPARVNLTISQAALSALFGLPASRGSPGRPGGPWAFTPRDDPGPPGGQGTWTLALPGGREFAVRLGPVPVFDCDHRHESHAYKPNDTLRHLVQVRDGSCTFPSCSHHARESDFEHAVPYEKGGRTCACNAGARSRGCHRVKQSKGWNVTQPRPGWHQWTTPSGRTYTQGPKRYPA